MSRVSVIIPCYNRVWSLGRALDSVLAQSYRDFDVWIVDDGSDDGTPDVLEDYQRRHIEVPIHILKTENRGVSAARNLAVAQSPGEYLAFLDSDDQWKPSKLAEQMALFDQVSQDTALVHSLEEWVRDGVVRNVPRKYRKFEGRVYPQCLPVCMIGMSTAVIRREAFVEAGGFDEDFPACEDYDLWLRLCSRRPVALVDQALVVKYGGHDDQLSTATPELDRWRLRALLKVLPTLSAGENLADLTREEISRRATILAKGYRKYGKDGEFRGLVREVRGVIPGFG